MEASHLPPFPPSYHATPSHICGTYLPLHCLSLALLGAAGDCNFKQEMLRGNVAVRAQFQKCVRRRAELSGERGGAASVPVCLQLTCRWGGVAGEGGRRSSAAGPCI